MQDPATGSDAMLFFGVLPGVSLGAVFSWCGVGRPWMASLAGSWLGHLKAPGGLSLLEVLQPPWGAVSGGVFGKQKLQDFYGSPRNLPASRWYVLLVKARPSLLTQVWGHGLQQSGREGGSGRWVEGQASVAVSLLFTSSRQ